MDVALFVTCLVDFFRPSAGFATVKLLEDAGCRVHVPADQTCCGQPAYNNGDRDGAQAIAKQVISAFAGFSYVVVPSGSCAGMLKLHYPRLFSQQSEWQARALDLAERTCELTQFLSDVLEVESLVSSYPGRITHHDSCSCLRELKVHDQPRRLLNRVGGTELVEPDDAEACCGFGGTFSIKYSDISTHMVSEKAERILATGADTLVGADLGCLLNIAGRLQRMGRPIKVYHIAEVLAGMTGEPGIGEGRS